MEDLADPRMPLLATGSELVWRSGDRIRGRSTPGGWDRLRVGLAFAPALPAGVLVLMGVAVGSLPVMGVAAVLGWWAVQGGQAILRRADEMGSWEIALDRGLLDLEGHERRLRGARVCVERDGALGPLAPAWLVIRWPDGGAARLARGRRRELARLVAVVEEAVREAERRREIRQAAWEASPEPALEAAD